MQALLGSSRRRLAVLVVAGFAVAGGVAYATIPDSGNVYTACMLNKVGTIRLIDPSLGNSSLMGHCVALETQISWHQQGQKGDPGVPGKNGTNGTNGVSPTVAQLAAGDPHCVAGGAAITDAAGSTAYVCGGQNGKDGQDGQSFAGTFTSPNGQFSLKVADAGVVITGPGTSITFGVDVRGTGTMTVRAGFLHTVVTDETDTANHDRNVEVGNDETQFVGADRVVVVDHDETLHVKHDRNETVDNNQTTSIHGNRAESIDRNQTATFSGNRLESVSGTFALAGGLLALNGAGTCSPAARVGDTVTPAFVIASGSPTVCIGG